MSFSGISKISLSPDASMVPAQSAAGKSKIQSNANSSNNSGGLSSSTTGTTFLNLLVKELQNQDPSAPMDSTAMVGQMISLNQLDQLISINQIISGGTTSASSNPKVVAQTAAAQATVAASGDLLKNTNSSIAFNQDSSSSNYPNTILNLSNLKTPYGGK